MQPLKMCKKIIYQINESKNFSKIEAEPNHHYRLWMQNSIINKIYITLYIDKKVLHFPTILPFF